MQIRKHAPKPSRRASSICPAGVFLFVLVAAAALSFSAVGGRLLSTKAEAGGDGGRGVSRVSGADAEARRRFNEAYGKLPLRFEANGGQADGRVKFLARGVGYSLFLTESGAVVRLRKAETPKGGESDGAGARDAAGQTSTLRIGLDGANRSPKIVGADELPGRSNYLMGADARRWRTGVSAFAKVRYESVYKGVDVVYYGREGRLEYDFVVAPGSDPSRIRLRFEGARSESVDEGGDLILATEAGDLRQRKPVAYQEVGGERREVQARYVKGSRGAVGIELGDYDHKLPLVVDPVLIYSSYIADASQEPPAVAVGPDGSAYIVGTTASDTFPGPSPIQVGKGGLTDAYVLKLSPDGKSIVYATYLGGDGSDTATRIALDAAGNAYVTGWTTSSNFPTTAGAAQTARADNYTTDAFVAKLNPTGSALVYSTYLGGDHSDKAAGIAVGADGAAYVVGPTYSTAIASVPVGVRGGHALLKSVDGAGHWNAADAGLPGNTVNAFAVQPTDQNVIYAATNTGLFKSTNGGTSWQATGALPGGIRVGSAVSVVVDPSDPNTVYTGMGGGFYKSTDGGNSFQQKMGSMPSTLLAAPTTPTTLYAGLGGGVYKSTNGGESWTKMSSGITGSTPFVSKLVFDPSNPSVVYAGAASGVFKTTNGGGLWSAVNTGLPASGPIRALAEDPMNPSTLYVTFSNFFTDVYKSTDSGAHWAVAGAPLTVTAGGKTFNPSVISLVVDPASPSTLYAGTVLGGVFKSIDGGANWAASNSGLTNKIVNALLLTGGGAPAVYAGTSVGNDVFVAKLNQAGSQLAYLKTLAGSENDDAGGIAVGLDGSAYITGTTLSSDFPLANAFQQAFNGSSDAFVAKLNPTGSALTYSTFLGGSSAEEGLGIALDAAGSAYVAGDTFSTDFPSSNAAQPARGDSITNDAFVTKFAPDGGSLIYSTYVGGSSSDSALAIAVGGDGSAYITGQTLSADFPIKDAVQPTIDGEFGYDAFVTKLNPSGSAFAYSTYLGGLSDDMGTAIAVDAAGGAYVVGTTFSGDFPVVNSLPGSTAHFGSFAAKIGAGVDLAVSMTDSPDPVAFGGDLTYAIGVKNNGDLQATGVTLTDVLPAGTSLVSATASQGSCSGAASVVCGLGTLGGGASATVTIVVKPPAARTIENTATVTLNETDAVLANNSASATTTVDFADLSVSKSVLSATASPGSKVVYLLAAKNNSGKAAGPVTISDTLPAELTFVSCDSPHGVCGGTGNSRSVTFSSLDVGAKEGAVIVVTVNQSVAGGAVVNNTATVSSATADPNASNNSASVSFTAGSSAPGPKSNGLVLFASADGIYTINADGTGRTKIHSKTPDSSVERFPVFSPDGTKVVFYREVSTSSSVTFEYYVMNADGSNLHRVSTNGALDSRATWSPDGSHVAFIGRDFGLYAAAADGTDETRIAASLGIAQGLDWSPDGTRFVFSKDFTHLFIMDVDGSNQRQLTFTQHTPDGDTADTDPFWTFDGSRIVFTRRTNDGAEAFVINPDGTGIARLLNTSVARGQISPDGTKLLCLCSPEGMGVMNLDGTGLPVSLGGGGDPVWGATPNPNPSPTPTPVQTFTISGHITGPDGFTFPLTVKLSGTRAATRGVDANGNYSFVNLPRGGHYTVTPAVNGTLFTSFTPGSRTIGDLEGDLPDFDFTVKTVQHIVKGRVTNPQGQPMQGVTVSLFTGFGARRDTTTDSDGGYSFPMGAGGDGYSIQPSFSSFSFDPIRAVLPTVTGDVTANFVGTPFSNARGISGRVVDASGNSIAGLPVTLGGARSATVKTDSNGFFAFANLPTGQGYTVTPSAAEGFTFSPPQQAFNNFSFDQFAGFNATATQPTAQFASANVSVAESAHSVLLTVTRSGDTSASASVDYETSDLTSSERADYIASFGVVRFAKGEASQTIKLLITDNNRVDGERLFTVTLKGGSGARVGSPNAATVRITDDDTPSTPANPVDSSQFFVRQHYADFLNREPDDSGLQFWTNEIESCGADAQCREVKRVNVSAAFFLSIEFQQTGYLVYRLHQAAFGSGQALRLNTFLKDTQDIGRGVVVGQGDWQGQLEANKQAFVSGFVLRPEFLNAYPTTLSPALFVDSLNANTGGSLTQAERDSLVASLTTGTSTRASVLRSVAENAEFSRRESNRAFVLMQYFGYLRRSPADPPDSDFSGWQFWLSKLNQFNGDFIKAEMVKAFISSDEYRKRFGQ
jgi:uncharacterized repeat protein (TIGR01451 family)